METMLQDIISNGINIITCVGRIPTKERDTVSWNVVLAKITLAPISLIQYFVSVSIPGC